jgi:hypothetical protein
VTVRLHIASARDTTAMVVSDAGSGRTNPDDGYEMVRLGEEPDPSTNKA